MTSSHTKGESSFLTESAVSEQEICHVIEETGYTFLSYENSPYEKKGLFGR